MVRAALELYRSRGMNGTGFKDVLAAASASRGAIYHHFPGGKEELAASVIDANGRDLLAFLDHLLAERSPGDTIRRFVAWYADRLDASRQEFGCPIAPTVLEAANDSEPIAAAANAVFESWITRLADALRAKGVSCQQARRCAATVVAGIEGALVLSRAARSAQLLRDIGAELANTLDAAVAAASTTDASRRR